MLHFSFPDILATVISAVATGILGWVGSHVKKYINYEFLRKFAIDQVMAVEQQIGKTLEPEEKRNMVIDYIHKKFPKVPLWIISNLVEAAVKKMNQGETNA